MVRLFVTLSCAMWFIYSTEAAFRSYIEPESRGKFTNAILAPKCGQDLVNISMSRIKLRENTMDQRGRRVSISDIG
jgi:hypothetical protein